MLVHTFLERSAQHSPEAVALIEPGRSVKYGELDGLANRFAHVLLRSGVRRGDRVVIAMDTCIELAAAYFGTMKAGAIAVPLPGGAKSDRLSNAVLDCTPSAAIVDSATIRCTVADHPLGSVRNLFVLERPRARDCSQKAAHGAMLTEALALAPDSPPGVRSIDLDLAAIIYTSGSTGAPRGVTLTHGNIVANTHSIVEYLELTARDRVMCVLPFYYVYGLSLLHTHMAVGGSVVIDNRFVLPTVVLNAMRQHRVTGFAGVPSTFVLLLQRSNIDTVSLPALRYVTQAGGAMAPARITEWLQRGPKVPFYVMYGATEASARLTYLDPSQLKRKLGSVGRAIPNVEIAVVRSDGGVAGPGEIGELVARGSNISKGYWNNPDETRQKFGPLGYRTGDLGYFDEDGYVFIVGRLHDMMKVGAHRVGAKEIEDVLHEHPAVGDAAVVSAPDDLLGEVPVAFLTLRTPLTNATESLRGFCGSRLPAHKVPSRVVILDELPQILGLGKIDRQALRSRAASLAVAH